MTTISTIVCRLRRRGARCFSAGDGGGGGGGGGGRRNCSVGAASAGDCGLGILLVSPASAGGYGPRGLSVGGPRPLGGGPPRAIRAGGGLPPPRQSGLPGRWGGVPCAILPHPPFAGGPQSV